jgi:hypothetical protein
VKPGKARTLNLWGRIHSARSTEVDPTKCQGAGFKSVYSTTFTNCPIPGAPPP